MPSKKKRTTKRATKKRSSRSSKSTKKTTSRKRATPKSKSTLKVTQVKHAEKNYKIAWFIVSAILTFLTIYQTLWAITSGSNLIGSSILILILGWLAWLSCPYKR